MVARGCLIRTGPGTRWYLCYRGAVRSVPMVPVLKVPHSVSTLRTQLSLIHLISPVFSSPSHLHLHTKHGTPPTANPPAPDVCQTDQPPAGKSRLFWSLFWRVCTTHKATTMTITCNSTHRKGGKAEACYWTKPVMPSNIIDGNSRFPPFSKIRDFQQSSHCALSLFFSPPYHHISYLALPLNLLFSAYIGAQVVILLHTQTQQLELESSAPRLHTEKANTV